MLNWLDKYFENTIAVILLVIMTAAIFLQVVSRTFDYSIAWTEELARYCFIWLVYIGISFAVSRKSHIKIEAIAMLIDEKEKKYLSLFSDFVFLAFSVVILFKSTQMVANLYYLGQTSPALGLPMWIVYLAGPVGFALTSIRLIQQMVSTTDDIKTAK
ncbi:MULTISPECIES: TRAP transporter small permease [Vibrio]|uniref:TRAP transporter small permease protein n=2 Tax=Vibrio TaxID=662 RepID=A0A837P1L9_VIBSP|nr:MULTISPECIES: TRAP transporter small permease [Vibrio]KPL96204.1 C4-dicarboxylate ABC transporter [Vibrio splendidus]PML59872.1 C4-dicarboxylate ABC transporter [Vibrio lentus]PMM29826.1 C4-dicarboxylate ABC transporter [Vibrio lentus]